MTHNGDSPPQPLDPLVYAGPFPDPVPDLKLYETINRLGLQIFSWDAPHGCGITFHYETAIAEARAAVTAAEIGTVAEVKGGHLSGELPKRVMGRAERTSDGVAWLPNF